MLAAPAQDDLFSSTSAVQQITFNSFEAVKVIEEQGQQSTNQQEENGESIQLLINTFLETLDQHQDIQVIQKRLIGVADSKVASERSRILNDIQAELHQVSLQVEEKRKIVMEKEEKLNQMTDEKNILLSNINHLKESLQDETVKSEKLAQELLSINEALNRDMPLNLSVLTLSVFNQLGIDFIDWNADKQAFEKFITKSVSENRMSSNAMDMGKYSRGYYPDLLWNLVSQ